jgi:hypothetical protein
METILAFVARQKTRVKPMSEEKQVVTLIAFSFIVLIVLAGFLIWRPAGHAAPPHGSQCSCPFCSAASAGNPKKQGKLSAALPPVGNRAASKSPYLLELPSRTGQISPKPATEPAAAGKVVATVNGEPISESELMASLPDDAFQTRLDNLKESKLKRLVEEAVEWQFLKDRKVTLSDAEFEKAAADFATMVKTPGCPCCGGGFASVEQFMQVRAFSPRELHRRITCDGGLKLYAARLEHEQTSPQALAETLKKRRAEIEKDCTMAYTIAFDYTRAGVYFRDDQTLHAQKEKIANDAFARLRKGDCFEKVARDMSQAGLSDPKGGALECIRADLLDPEVQRVLGTLEPGKFSPVIKTAWGCSIVKRKKLTDEDILSVVKEQAKTSAEDQMYEELDAWRKRAQIEYSAAYAPASAAVTFGTK